MFDRNVRAFGGAIQATLSDLRVGVAGCGGTGSAVAEQLVRLGVRHLVLLDPDHLSASNVTRVYGSTPEDVGQLKVDVLRRHLSAIAPGLRVQTSATPVTQEAAARTLITCDVVFGCTDDNAGRLVLSRLPTYLLMPVIDCGVLLSSGEDGVLTGIDGRVTVVAPGTACLVCRNPHPDFGARRGRAADARRTHPPRRRGVRPRAWAHRTRRRSLHDGGRRSGESTN